MRKSNVKDAVFKVIKSEIESGRLTKEQLLKPRVHGQCNDTAVLIQFITTNSAFTNETVRSETVLRYVREYKQALKNGSIQ